MSVALRVWYKILTSRQSPDNPVMLSPGFANESKVDHLTIIIEVRLACVS